MKSSAIGWTDFSGGDLNFVTGCTPVSEGCAHCYARRIYERFGRDFSKVTFHKDKLERLHRKQFPEYSPKRGAPHKTMCFVCDTGDLFHESVGPRAVFEALDVMAWRDDIVWQVLTKRPAIMKMAVNMWLDLHPVDVLPSHIWLGVTAENQRCADERIPILVDTPATVRFVSVEPMLEPMDLSWDLVRLHEHTYTSYVTRDMAIDAGDRSLEGQPFAEETVEEIEYGVIDWLICGAESGPNRRPFDVAWAVDLYQQCGEAGTAFFGKQDSGLYPGEPLVLGDYGVVHEWPEADGWGAQDDDEVLF